MVRLTANEAHLPHEVLHDLLKERVVLEEVYGYVEVFYLQKKTEMMK